MSNPVFTGRNGLITDQPHYGEGMPETIIAGLNAILTNGRWRAFGGVEDKSENRTISNESYTISFTNGDPVATASGAINIRENQHVLINRKLYVVEQKLTTTTFRVAPTPDYTQSGLAIARVPVLTRIDKRRASLYQGSVAKHAYTSLFTVGDGRLRINGADTSGTIDATSTLQVSYPNGSGVYTTHNAGFDVPSAPIVGEGSAGTKNMIAGGYPIAVSRARDGFPGYGNASDRAVAALSTSGKKVSVTLDAFDTAQGQNAWIVWVPRGRELASPTSPGLWLGQKFNVESTTVELEWFDDELTERLTYDNDTPPLAQQVLSAFNRIVLVGTGGLGDGTPGPEIAACKLDNPEAFSPFGRARTVDSENIVGAHPSRVAIFLLTANSLQTASPTGNTATPFEITRQWEFGFSHQFNAVTAYDYLYGFSGEGLHRTFSTQQFQPEDDFAKGNKSIFRGFHPARTFLGFDQYGEMLVIFNSNHHQGTGGGWVTQAWSYNLKTGQWNAPCDLGNGTDDFTVTSCVTVQNHLYISTADGKTYQWDAGSSEVSGYIAPPFQTGASAYLKFLRSVKVTGNLTGRVRAYFDLDIDGLIAGDPSAPTFTLTGDGSGTSIHHPVIHMNSICNSYALRLEFDAATDKELVFDAMEVEAVEYGGFKK